MATALTSNKGYGYGSYKQQRLWLRLLQATSAMAGDSESWGLPEGGPWTKLVDAPIKSLPILEYLIQILVFQERPAECNCIASARQERFQSEPIGTRDTNFLWPRSENWSEKRTRNRREVEILNKSQIPGHLVPQQMLIL
ncbi:hypothetical protein GCK72_003138 [Caenorhabditis remanei]|uniref:Uncharacterized protein n=1 Tax=Caenorhabditis remanei TaxID=31234 RepID=A0A6A5HYI4_CAERE|nr:hypothetical protein GCK72_003138 [Caenorhabditis remanei]KAF1771312.1 hypothetical protein GCK72_003138 [Caenorhabditis remanei]